MDENLPVIERVRKIVAEKFEVEASRLESGADLVNDLGFDSMNLIELVMAIEDEFGVSFSEEETDGITLLGDISSLLMQKMGKELAGERR